MAQAGLADTGGADARGLIAAAHATPSCGASHATHALAARHHLLRRAPPQVPATTFVRGAIDARAIHFWSKAFVDFRARVGAFIYRQMPPWWWCGTLLETGTRSLTLVSGC